MHAFSTFDVFVHTYVHMLRQKQSSTNVGYWILSIGTWSIPITVPFHVGKKYLNLVLSLKFPSLSLKVYIYSQNANLYIQLCKIRYNLVAKWKCQL